MKIVLIPMLVAVSVLYAAIWFGRENSDVLPSWFPAVLLPKAPPSRDLVMDFTRTGACLSVDRLKQRFAGLRLECAEQQSSLGDYVCWTDLKTFNGMQAKEVTFFFEAGLFNQVRVTFPVPIHSDLLNYLNRNYGKAPLHSTVASGEDITAWVTPSGRLTTYVEEPVNQHETLLLWTSHRAIAKPGVRRAPASTAEKIMGSLFDMTYGDGRFCDGV